MSDRQETKYTHSREEGVIDREAWVFCRCADECDHSLLDPRKKCILLRFAPAMDLIKKQNCLQTACISALCLGDNLEKIFFFGEDS